MLKVKAFIYRFTGVFLAEKEIVAHLGSKEGYLKVIRIMSHYGMSLDEALKTARGSWKADKGFYRPYDIKTIKAKLRINR